MCGEFVVNAWFCVDFCWWEKTPIRTWVNLVGEQFGVTEVSENPTSRTPHRKKWLSSGHPQPARIQIQNSYLKVAILSGAKNSRIFPAFHRSCPQSRKFT
jgi:hypothetical protein